MLVDNGLMCRMVLRPAIDEARRKVWITEKTYEVESLADLVLDRQTGSGFALSSSINPSKCNFPFCCRDREAINYVTFPPVLLRPPAFG
jgi:hypothetical protein